VREVVVAEVVGVHGILKQQLGRHQLRGSWGPALADGLERAAGVPVEVPDLEVAFYGDLFLPGPRRGAGKGVEVDDLPPELVGLADAEVDVLEAATEEVAGAEAAGDGVKGFLSSPAIVQGLLRRLDGVFGARAAGVLYLGALRQVHGYLRDAQLKAAIDARVDAAVGSGCRVLVGHSLGSVVALEFLRRHPGLGVDLFVTIGSPLGLRLVQDLLPEDAQRLTARPGNVGAWVNVWDPRDPVACAGGLGRRWAGVVDDATVNNQADTHAAERYLSKRQVGAPVAEALYGRRPGDGGESR
jgi:hypothetical protein